jgi:hypothetical protein
MPRKTATDLIEKADSTRRTLVAEDLLVICNACRQSQEGAAHHGYAQTDAAYDCGNRCCSLPR